jgi:hypothetical protein
MLGSRSIDMGSMDRLEAWLKADKKCPPVLYRPQQAATTDEEDFGRGFEKVRRELRRVGRRMLELSAALDDLRRRSELVPTTSQATDSQR